MNCTAVRPIGPPLDDWFSEAVNFRFEVDGVLHLGLVDYESLEERFGTEGADGPMCAFILHADTIKDAAAVKVVNGEPDPIRLAAVDL